MTDMFHVQLIISLSTVMMVIGVFLQKTEIAVQYLWSTRGSLFLKVEKKNPEPLKLSEAKWWNL